MNNYFKLLVREPDPQKLISDKLWDSWIKCLINTPYASMFVLEIADSLGLKWPYKSRLDKISDYLQCSIHDIINLSTFDKEKSRTLILCIAHLALKKGELKDLVTQCKKFVSKKASKIPYKNIGNVPIFRSVEYVAPASFSILRKTILNILDIDEKERNYIWDSFGHLTLSNLDILSNKWDNLGLHFIYSDDPLDSILALTLGYIHTVWNNESNFKEIIDNILCLIKKLLKRDISLEISSFCSYEKIFPNSYCSLLNELTISPTFVYPDLVYKLRSHGIFKWSDIFEISEWDIVRRYGFCAKVIDLLKCIWLLIPHAKNTIKLLELKTDPKIQWGSFEELFESWILLRTNNKRNVDILMRRLGWCSNDSETLESIANKYKITREAVRQIEKRLLIKLNNRQSIKKLDPLWVIIDSSLQLVGVISVSELALQLQSYLKWEQPPHQYALIYFIIEVGPEQVFRKDLYNNEDRGFIFAKNFLCNDCIQICEYLMKVISNSEEISLIEATNILNMFCRKECLRDYKYYFHFTHTFIDFLFVSNKWLNDHIRKKDDKLYSINRWNLRYGNFSSLVESILKSNSRAMHFKEVFDKAKKLRPEDSLLSERYVHAILSGSQKVLLWERGTFLHKENLAAFPYGLIREVEDWIAAKLKQDIPFVSVSGAYLAFRDKCIESGITSEYALYSCLRMSGENHFVFAHFPRIYSKKSVKEKLPIPMVIEEFIRESGGPISSFDLRKYAIETLHLKEYMLNNYLDKIPNIIRIKKGSYLHTDNFKIDNRKLSEIIDYSKKVLSKDSHASIVKIFNDKKILCKQIGIDTPELLFSLFRIYASDEIGTRNYPQINLIDEDIDKGRGVLKEVVEYIKNKKSSCSYQEIEDYFVTKLGYSEQIVYYVSRDKNIHRYLQSCLIHNDTIEWTEEKQIQLEKIALQVYSDAVAAGKCYGLVENILEIEYDNLPILANDICWTEILLAELLNKSYNFKVIGSRKNAFVTLPNKFNIETFEDLLYVILKNDYNGAANLKDFARNLKEIGIIEKGITKTMLDDSKKVTISGGEIILMELIHNAQKA